MKKIWLLLFVMAMFCGTSLFAGDGEKLGKDLTLSDTTLVSEIIANPEAFVGKKLLIKGLILDVCPKRGCWINVASDKPFEQLRVKVKDGEIVFPTAGKGKTVTVEGVFAKFELTKEQAIQRAKHMAEEKGEKFDPASITGPQAVYQLNGSGAVLDK